MVEGEGCGRDDASVAPFHSEPIDQNRRWHVATLLTLATLLCQVG